MNATNLCLSGLSHWQPQSWRLRNKAMGSLVLAIEGLDEVIMAGDRLAYTGDEGGYYKFESGRKLLHLAHRNWVLGFAGTQIGEQLYDVIQNENDPLDTEIHRAAHGLARRMHALYLEYQLKADASILLAGIQDGKPAIYRWRLATNPDGKDAFDPAQKQWNFDAIGAQYHGALYFLSTMWAENLTTEQRILLGHFCLQEVGKCDPRVGGINIAVVRQGEVRFLSQDDLAEVRASSEEIARAISSLFRRDPANNKK